MLSSESSVLFVIDESEKEQSNWEWDYDIQKNPSDLELYPALFGLGA